jgi:hypothetical protein
MDARLSDIVAVMVSVSVEGPYSYYLWNQVGEYPFDAFMMQQQRANAL